MLSALAGTRRGIAKMDLRSDQTGKLEMRALLLGRISPAFATRCRHREPLRQSQDRARHSYLKGALLGAERTTSMPSIARQALLSCSARTDSTWSSWWLCCPAECATFAHVRERVRNGHRTPAVRDRSTLVVRVQTPGPRAQCRSARAREVRRQVWSVG